MDPINNPTPTPAPEPAAPTPGPVPPVPPVPSAPVAPEAPVTPPTPETPAAPVVPPAPIAPESPVVPPAPAASEVPLPTVPEGIEAAAADLAANPAPVNPVFEPGGVAATDPIMMPEPAKAPDPVEEELKAPMKAAAPVPGSIGSAVSGPAEGEEPVAPAENPFDNKGQTPSVSFSDPTTQPDAKAAKGKMNKNTLIILVGLALVVVVVLVVMLVMMMTSSNNTSSSPSTPAAVVENDNKDDNEDEDVDVVTNNTLSCTRNMKDDEIIKYNDAISGTINISAEFNDDNSLNYITLVESVVYSDEDASGNEPVEMEVHESTVDKLNTASALNFYLEPDELGEFDFSRDAIEARYQSLDFTCEVL